jgi:hypothetical protein
MTRNQQKSVRWRRDMIYMLSVRASVKITRAGSVSGQQLRRELGL